MLSGKGPIRITMPNPWPCTGHPKNYTMCLRAVQTVLALCQAGAVITSLGSLFQCPTTLWVKNPFPDIQHKPTLIQLHALSLGPVTGDMSEEIKKVKLSLI